MTTSRSNAPQPDDHDVTELAKTILDGDRRQLAERPPRPVRRIRPDELTSLRAPAIVVQLLLAGWVVFGVVAIGFGVAQRSLLHRLASNPARVTIAEALTDQRRTDTLNPVSVGLLIATGIAIGGWFVPFFNFVRPKQVADDIWASVNVSKYGDIGERGGSFLLALWWTAWIGASIVGFFARDGADEEAVEQTLTTNGVYIARDVGFIVAALLAVWVVRCITRAQNLAAEGA